MALDPHTRAEDTTKRDGLSFARAVTVGKPIAEVYAGWRDFTHFPRFMKHIESVTALDAEGRRSHWVARIPANNRVEWDAELTEDRPNELIAWRSLPGATIANSGEVRFARATGDRGTVVRATITYHTPANPVAHLVELVAQFFNAIPSTEAHSDLLRFKEMLETGEIATIEGQPSGREKVMHG